MGSVLMAIARLIRLAVAIVVLVIAAAVVLRLLSANPGNVIVRDIHDAGRALVGPFKDVFSPKNAKVSMAINWGLAAVVYLIVGGLIASVLARAAPRGVPPAERVPPAEGAV
jgi:CDP-diglyceride synthetase